MNAEQLLLVLPGQTQSAGGPELTIHNWTALLEQFAAQDGREVLLGGAEPLAFPGFWVLARKALKLHIPRVTVYLSGSLLEPWVMRELVESGVHLLVALDSVQPDAHDVLHGTGSHARAMAATETFLKQGLQHRVGVLATATRLSKDDQPMLAAWAGGKGLQRFLWTSVPDGGWPSPSLRALRLSPEEKTALALQMEGVARGLGSSLYVGPLDILEDSALSGAGSRLVRVNARGEACWGFSGEGGQLGNVRYTLLKVLIDRMAQAAGD